MAFLYAHLASDISIFSLLCFVGFWWFSIDSFNQAAPVGLGGAPLSTCQPSSGVYSSLYPGVET